MKKVSASVIDYGMGNIHSVISAIEYLGVNAKLVSEPEELEQSEFLFLPGVGSFRKGMESLKERGLDTAIRTAVLERKSKILGICLGMQLMGKQGMENGSTVGLGLISNKVDKFANHEVGQLKLPHVGFNSIAIKDTNGLFKGLSSPSDFYFTHEYRLLVGEMEGRYATCTYGIDFLAAFEMNNICGVQFHPEKSQSNGLILIKNFLSL